MRIVFMGTPSAAVPTLDRLISDGHEIIAVYTQPDRPSGRGNKIIFSPVKEFALARNIPIFQPTKVKTALAANEFKALNADIAVVVAYGRILPEAFLKAFSHGAINVHFSLLPKYRGAAPVNWAIVNGETVTGVTTMKMDEGLDTGDVLLQRETPIGTNETSIELMQRLSVLGAELCSETLASFNQITQIPQDHSQATYAPIMKKSDGLIDWALPAEQIVNRVRGFQPFPSSFTFLDGKRITLWEAVVGSSIMRLDDADPGMIVEASRDRLLVAAGENSVIELLSVQMEGKRRVPIRDLLNSGAVIQGMKFGGNID